MGNPAVLYAVVMCVVVFIAWNIISVLLGKQLQKQNTQRQQLIDDFVQAVTDYRNLAISNYNARVDEVEDAKPLERTIAELFKEGSAQLQSVFLFYVLKILACPDQCLPDNEWVIRQNAMLQKLAFDTYDQLQKILLVTRQKEGI